MPNTKKTELNLRIDGFKNEIYDHNQQGKVVAKFSEMEVAQRIVKAVNLLLILEGEVEAWAKKDAVSDFAYGQKTALNVLLNHPSLKQA